MYAERRKAVWLQDDVVGGRACTIQSRPATPSIWLDVNGQHRQDSSTANLIFGIARLVSCISQFMALYPGDNMTLGVNGLGVQVQTCRA